MARRPPPRAPLTSWCRPRRGFPSSRESREAPSRRGSLLQGRRRSSGPGDKCPPPPPPGARGATPSPRTKPRRRPGVGEKRAKEKLGRGRRGRGAERVPRPPQPPTSSFSSSSSPGSFLGRPRRGACRGCAPGRRSTGPRPPRPPPPRPCATGSCGSRGRRVWIAARNPGGGGARGGGTRRRRPPPLLPPGARGRCGGGREAGGRAPPPHPLPARAPAGLRRAGRGGSGLGDSGLAKALCCFATPPPPAPWDRDCPPPSPLSAGFLAPGCPWPWVPRPALASHSPEAGGAPGSPPRRRAEIGAPGPPGAENQEAATGMRDWAQGRAGGLRICRRPGALARDLSSARPVAISGSGPASRWASRPALRPAPAARCSRRFLQGWGEGGRLNGKYGHHCSLRSFASRGIPVCCADLTS